MGKFVEAVRRALVFLVGRWEPPPWARFLGGRAEASGRWARAHKAPAVAGLVVLAALGAGGGFGYRWWKNRPKPLTTAVAVMAPSLTRIGDKTVIYPVVVDFDGSVAPLKAIGQTVKTGIELLPKTEGTWKWGSDRQLRFEPRSDWPVGQAYKLRLAKKGLVADHINLETYALEFQTAPFTVSLAESEFYQDPVDPNLKKVVATFRFSHPVEPTSFEKAVKMRFEPSNKEDKSFDAQVQISYDKWKLQAYVHSAAFPVPQQDANVVITLGKGTHAARGGPAFDEVLTQSVRIPGVFNFFRVQSARPQIVDNARMEPEQLLVLALSAGATESEISKATSAWVLPLTNPDEPETGAKRRAYRWSDPDRVSPTILRSATKLPLSQIAAEKEYAEVQSFRFQADVGRYVYVQVKKGVKAYGGYVLGETFQAIFQVPAYPRQLKVMSKGSLVALGGDRRVSIFARDVPGIRFEIARVLPDQLHHLVTQSSGEFGQPGWNYSFGPENLADFQIETRAMTAKPGKPSYESLDLGKYLADGRRGVFLLKTESWDPESKNTLGERDQRLVLVTDLGLLVKRAADGSQDVFVQSIRTGEPVAGVRVQLIGKNGQPVLSDTTTGDGHANFPALNSFRGEKQPVMYLATLGRDSSFLPIGRYDRTLDLSRFDVGGVSESGGAKGLTAFLFSDRGVYRPGDEFRIGMIVKSRDWAVNTQGLPLEAEITDARGLTVKRQRFKLGAAGFEELKHATQEVSPTGTYTVNLYTVKDGHADALLGSTSVVVREFLPDRMVIKAHLSEERIDGWVPPEGLAAKVSLANLFGTPAVGRRVRGQLTLTPGLPSFGKLRGFHFYDPLRAKEPVSQPLIQTETDDEGNAEFDLGLKRFAPATYRLTFLAEGFEAEGGRSVTAEASVVVSPLAHLIGWKADGDLGSLAKDSEHSVELVAVGPTGAKTAVRGLKAALVERKWVSVLARQPNGTYKYDSKRKEVELRRDPLPLGAEGTKHKLPTGTPGDFALSIRDADDKEIQRIEFSVTGIGNLTRDLDKNTELQIALTTPDIQPGSDIELQIKAPFTGAGLITIERDRVYAWKWFKADTTASLQTIKVPAELEGGGYVSIAFIRDPSSDEVFTSPLSYGVVPFSISRARRIIDLKVTTADLVKPGTAFKMKVRADKPGRAVVFAIDEGVLRVARYSAPDPLAAFFQKRALAVQTTQILDLILPEFSKLMQVLSAPGGDGEGEAAIGANLNPFKRRRDKPVAYWSGLVDVGPDERELSYEVPDSFNGTLRVMAVAVSQTAIGTFEKTALVRGDFVFSPNVPTFVAPGDEFDVPVSVSNNVAGSGSGNKKASVNVSLRVSPQLEIVGPAKTTLAIAELREATATFKLRARDVLGSATLTFEADLGDKHGKLGTDVSVRPATPFLSTMTVGYLKNQSKKVDVPRKLYAEYRDMTAGISAVPLSLAHGLAGYLEKYPYGCTEQVVSQTMPAVALGKRSEFGFSAKKAADSIDRLIDVLRARQNDEGGFGLWAANPRVAPLPSVYALHLLTEARERGYPVPADLMRQGLAYLQSVAGTTPDDLPGARLRAYAIYVLTRNEMVTTSFVAAAQKNLEANHPKAWKADLAGAYLAATYKLLHQEAPARDIIAQQKMGQPHAVDWATYYDGFAHDAQLLFLLSRHFPERAAAIGQADLDALVQPIANGAYNSFSSAHAILALEAYAARASEPGAAKRGIAEVIDGAAKHLTLPAGLLPVAAFTEKATALAFSSEGDFGSYWLMAQRGFDRAPPTKGQSNKIEVFREYLDAAGKPIKEVALGAEIRVRLRLRALGEYASNIAVVDLLPGGFEVVVQLPPARSEATPREGQEEYTEGEGAEDPAGDEAGEGESEADPGGSGAFSLPIALPESTFAPEYGDVREDRVVLYGGVGTDASTFVYVVKATNVGRYVVPPVQAEGMYDRTTLARGVADAIIIKAP